MCYYKSTFYLLTLLAVNNCCVLWLCCAQEDDKVCVDENHFAELSFRDRYFLAAEHKDKDSWPLREAHLTDPFSRTVLYCQSAAVVHQPGSLFMTYSELGWRYEWLWYSVANTTCARSRMNKLYGTTLSIIGHNSPDSGISLFNTVQSGTVRYHSKMSHSGHSAVYDFILNKNLAHAVWDEQRRND